MNLADQGTTGVRPEAAPTAANDDHHPANLPVAPTAALRADAPATLPVETPAGEAAGWDAFEIWRSRVRDPRRDASRAYRD